MKISTLRNAAWVSFTYKEAINNNYDIVKKLIATNPRYSDKITEEHLGHRSSPNPFCRECALIVNEYNRDRAVIKKVLVY